MHSASTCDDTTTLLNMIHHHVGHKGFFDSYRTPDHAVRWGPNADVFLASLPDINPYTADSLFWMIDPKDVQQLTTEIDRAIHEQRLLPSPLLENAGALFCVWESPNTPYVLAALLSTKINDNYSVAEDVEVHLNNIDGLEHIEKLGTSSGDNDLYVLWNTVGYRSDKPAQGTMARIDLQTHLMELFHSAVMADALHKDLEKYEILTPLDDHLAPEIVWHYWKHIEMQYSETDQDQELLDILEAKIERAQIQRSIDETNAVNTSAPRSKSKI